MDNQSLADELTLTVQELDTLIEKYTAGQQYAATRERLLWFHTLVQQFYDELMALKEIALSTSIEQHGIDGKEVWEQTCVEIKQQEPLAFQSPAKAFIHAHSDLLHIVAYTAQAHRLLIERRMQLMIHREIPEPACPSV